MRDKEKRAKIAELVKKIDLTLGSERAAKCGYDCLLQWNEGELDKTIKVWELFLKDGKCENQQQRHGVWVPAISL
jgi:hypothetical protein